MPILKWKDEFSVGVEIMDSEHRKLIAMINKAYDSVENMEEAEILGGLVEEMRQYAMSHFAAEEKLMSEYDYPYTAEHHKEHNEFMITAATTDNVLNSGKEVEPIRVFKFLADWLRGHILGTDRKLGKFLNSKGVN